MISKNTFAVCGSWCIWLLDGLYNSITGHCMLVNKLTRHETLNKRSNVIKKVINLVNKLQTGRKNKLLLESTLNEAIKPIWLFLTEDQRDK